VTEKDQLRAWVRAWATAQPELDRLRHQEFRETVTPLALEQLASAINHATRTIPPSPTSGLIEMQRFFAKLR
jgi:hypothetical protein